MKMAINVYEYGRGGKCVHMFRHTYAGIRIINMQIENEDRHMSRVMRITRALYQRYVFNSIHRKKTTRGMNTKPNGPIRHELERLEIQDGCCCGA